MPIQVNSDTYLTKDEAKEMLGGISDQTLRNLAKKYGIIPYKRYLGHNSSFYKKEDIEELIKMRPVKDNDEGEKNTGT
jgi:predicted DNA-binding transcriptional regulator AlpA